MNAAIYAALKAWVVAGTGGVPALFLNEPRPRLPKAIAFLALGTFQRIGIDVRFYRKDEEANLLVPVVRGIREFGLQVTIDTLTQNPAENAVFIAEELRSRGFLASSLAAPRAAGLVLVEVGDAAVADYEVDQRTISRVELSARWRVASEVEDPSAAIPWIETATVGHKLNP